MEVGGTVKIITGNSTPTLVNRDLIKAFKWTLLFTLYESGFDNVSNAEIITFKEVLDRIDSGFKIHKFASIY